MTTKEKIQQYIDYKGISIYRLEASAELSKGYWAKTKSISADVVMKISRIYTDLSTEWLLRGEGEMLKNEQPTPTVYQSGKNINASYQGTFNEPINTQIGDNNTFGDSPTKDDTKKKDKESLKQKQIYADFEADLHKYQMENDFLKHRVESLEIQLKQAIADKERAMNMLDKLINK